MRKFTSQQKIIEAQLEAQKAPRTTEERLKRLEEKVLDLEVELKELKPKLQIK